MWYGNSALMVLTDLLLLSPSPPQDLGWVLRYLQRTIPCCKRVTNDGLGGYFWHCTWWCSRSLVYWGLSVPKPWLPNLVIQRTIALFWPSKPNRRIARSCSLISVGVTSREMEGILNIWTWFLGISPGSLTTICLAHDSQWLYRISS